MCKMAMWSLCSRTVSMIISTTRACLTVLKSISTTAMLRLSHTLLTASPARPTSSARVNLSKAHGCANYSGTWKMISHLTKRLDQNLNSLAESKTTSLSRWPRSSRTIEEMMTLASSSLPVILSSPTRRRSTRVPCLKTIARVFLGPDSAATISLRVCHR